jgi:hypothetical protein
MVATRENRHAADTSKRPVPTASKTLILRLFGPTDPATYRPYNSGVIVIKKADSMTNFSVEDVLGVQP